MSIQTFKEKVRGFVSRIPTDKKKHLAAGFAICAIVSLLFGYVIGLIAATIAGAEKEARGDQTAPFLIKRQRHGTKEKKYRQKRPSR